MIQKLITALFGFCGHDKMTFPMTVSGVTSTSCLSCGRSFEYSLQDMRIGDEIAPEPYNPIRRPAGSNARIIEIAAKPKGRKKA